MFRASFIATLASSKRQWTEVDVTTYSLGKKATGRGYVSVQYPGLGQWILAVGRGIQGYAQRYYIEFEKVYQTIRFDRHLL